MNATGDGNSEGIYVELVRSLYTTLTPTMIMALSFGVVGWIVEGSSGDGPLLAMIILGMAAAASRIAVLLAYRRRSMAPALSVESALSLERRFTAAYMAFALAFGAFAARAIAVGPAECHVLIVGLLFGYGAGVAAGLSLRPWISVPSMLIAIVPSIVVSLGIASTNYLALAGLLTVFLAGGIQSVVGRHRHVSGRIAMSQLLASLAKRDDLTGLPNRLALRVWSIDADRSKIAAIHCLDLDRFKPVNDEFGHPVGDALLKAVAMRLNHVLRHCDFAARLGGDEFVVIQTQVDHDGEADMLARRLVRAIAQPYSIGERTITIGSSLGYAMLRPGDDLDTVMALADETLCAVKTRGGGILAHGEVLTPLRLARSA